MKKLLLISAFILCSCASTTPKETKDDETTLTPPPSSEEVMKDPALDVSGKIDSKVLKTLKFPSNTADIFVSLKMAWSEVDDCRDAVSKSGVKLYPGPALVPDAMFSANGNLVSVRKLARLKCVKKIELDSRSKKYSEPKED